MARAKGVWVEGLGLSQAGKDAKKDWKKEKDRLRTERAERRERPVPNYICYAAAFAKWRPGMPLPRCLRCDATLFPEENHKCEGYKPKFTERDREKLEYRRMEQREAIHAHFDEMRAERIREAFEYDPEDEMPSEAELEAMDEERLEELRRENGD